MQSEFAESLRAMSSAPWASSSRSAPPTLGRRSLSGRAGGRPFGGVQSYSPSRSLVCASSVVVSGRLYTSCALASLPKFVAIRPSDSQLTTTSSLCIAAADADFVAADAVFGAADADFGAAAGAVGFGVNATRARSESNRARGCAAVETGFDGLIKASASSHEAPVAPRREACAQVGRR